MLFVPEFAYTGGMKTAVLALVVGLTLGCNQDASPTKTSPESTSKTTGSSGSDTSPGSSSRPPANGPGVKLLDPGSGERRQLRFTATKGMKRSMSVTTEMTMSMAMGAQAMPPQKLPATRVTMDLEVIDVSGDGDIRYEFVARKPEVVDDGSTDPAVVAAMRGALSELEGMRGHGVVTSRGFTKEADIQVPANASAQTKQLFDGMRQSIDQIASPLPEEAVGVGAKWDTITTIRQNGLAIEQTATNRLVAIDGDTISLEIVMNQAASPQKFTANGVDAELESYSASGSGATSLGLAELVPSSSTVKMNSAMKMKAMGQDVGMTLALTMTLVGGE